jgi:hypothetical protein
VSAAARFYGTYYTTEPGGDNEWFGIPMRIFDVPTSGAKECYFKRLINNVDNNGSKGDITRNAVEFIKNVGFLTMDKPSIEVAALYPTLQFKMDSSALTPRYYDYTGSMRDLVDFDFVDETMVADNALDKYKVLVVLPGDLVCDETVEKIQSWVNNGGILVAGYDNELLFNTMDNVRKLKIKPGVTKVGKGSIHVFDKSTSVKPEYLKFVGDVVSNTILPIDNEPDGVYATRFDKYILYYNSTDKPVTKKAEVSRGKIVEIEVPAIGLAKLQYRQ